MLLNPSQYHRLEELLVRMLRLLTKNRFINTSNWETYLSREFDKRQSDKVNPLISGDMDQKENNNKDVTDNTNQNEKMESSSNLKSSVPFFSLSLEAKLDLLNDLCEWQLDEPDRLREHLDHEDDAIHWRVEPIGYDAKGNSYWLFDDNRLYKESKPLKRKFKNKKKRKSFNPVRRNTRRSARVNENDINNEEPEYTSSDDEENWLPWKLVCMTINDWNSFPQKFAKSTNNDEQYFFQLLINDVLPKVIPVIEENDKARKKYEAIASRKRSSRLIVREIEALEKQQMKMDGFNDTSRNGESGEGEVTLSRTEKRKLEKELKERERKTKEREERLLERERKQLEKLKAEEQAAEKARLEREKRLKRRTGSIDILDDSLSIINNNNNDNIILTKHQHDPSPILQQQQQQHDHQEKNIKKRKKYTKKSQKDRKDGKDEPAGKRKRGRKAKSELLQQYEDEESWVFNCLCGLFGKNLDDGTPMIACEKCNEWQHIDCLNRSKQIPEGLNNLEDISFMCKRCMEEEDKMDIDIDDITDDERTAKKQNISTTKGGFFSTFSIEQQDNPSIMNTSSTLPTLPPLRLTLHKIQQQEPQQLHVQQQSNNNNNNNTYFSSPSSPSSSSFINTNQSIIQSSDRQTINGTNSSQDSPKVTIINKVPINVSSFRHTVQPHSTTNSLSSSSTTTSSSNSSLLNNNNHNSDDITNTKSFIRKDYNILPSTSSSSNHHQQHQYHENQMEPPLLGNHTRHYNSLDPSSHSNIQHSFSAHNIPIVTSNVINNSSNNNNKNNSLNIYNKD
ncbi:unnamed protein product [Cunninghamella echinulata]